MKVKYTTFYHPVQNRKRGYYFANLTMGIKEKRKNTDKYHPVYDVCVMGDYENGNL